MMLFPCLEWKSELKPIFLLSNLFSVLDTCKNKKGMKRKSPASNR